MATAAGTLIVTTPNDREIHIERDLDAPRDLVWRAYTEPELLSQWWGRGHRLDVTEYDFKPGGHWRFVEHSPDGGLDGFEGRFAEIVPPVKIVETFDWDGLPGHPTYQTATFEDIGDGRTREVSTALFYTKEERDGMMGAGMTEGMEKSYAALDRLLAGMR